MLLRAYPRFWFRLSTIALGASQLPAMLTDATGTVIKPAAWSAKTGEKGVSQRFLIAVPAAGVRTGLRIKGNDPQTHDAGLECDRARPD